MEHRFFHTLGALIVVGAGLSPAAVSAESPAPPAPRPPVNTDKSAALELSAGVLDAAAFEARFAGKTVRYAQNGVFVGVDEFSAKGRRFIWRPAGGACEAGVWGPSDLNPHVLCFHAAWETPACWRFVIQDDGRILLFAVAPDGAPTTQSAPYAVSGVSEEGAGCSVS